MCPSKPLTIQLNKISYNEYLVTTPLGEFVLTTLGTRRPMMLEVLAIWATQMKVCMSHLMAKTGADGSQTGYPTSY